MTLQPKGGFRLDEELDRHWLNWALLAWAAVCVYLVISRQGSIDWLILGDTDDNMRLMQVRGLLHGQGWYDLTNYRLDPALGGYNIHWSRLVDLPIAGLILALQPFIGTAAAEKWACGIAPLLPLAITFIAMALTVRRLVAPAAWPLALVTLLACGSTLGMYLPMRIDHHGWQLACLALTVAGLADSKRARGGATVGLSSAMSLTIGLELLPYCALAGAVTAIRWIWDAGEARRMQVYGLALSGGTALGFAAFASNANQAMRCDALTPVYLSTMVAAGALLFALSLASPTSRWVRLALAAAAGAAIVTAFALLFPQCLGRPEGVSPELQNVWLDNVREARPIYRNSLSTAFPMGALPVIGIVGALAAIWRARGTPAMAGWVSIALFVAFAGATLLWQVRVAPAAQMLSVPGAVVLAWVVVPWCLRHRSVFVRVLGPVVALFVASGFFVGVALRYLPGEKLSGTGAKASNASVQCSRYPQLKLLDRIPAATMFTHVDLGPRLIVMTHHNGVAGPYHRNGRAILDVHHAFGGTASGFRPIALAHQAKYLLICPDLAETTVYRARNPEGFYAQLNKGQVPNWLEPIRLWKDAPYRLWRIRYDLPDAPVRERRQPAPPPGRP
ncbi:MAG: AcrB/AcrD/AcrF family protein [Pseudomonadota bacterium]